MKPLISILLASTWIFSGFAQQQNLSKKQRLTLDKTIQEILELSHCPGAAVAIVNQHGILYAKGFGYRDVEKEKPVTENTLFAIGSCTKAFTAALIGKREEEGSIKLDEPATQYHSELAFYHPEWNEQVTVRDLLCHRTGLPRHDLVWQFFDTDSRSEVVSKIRYLEPSTGLREDFQYNNLMYMTLGAMVEEASDKSWESAIREEIFAPLNMQRSNFSFKELENDPDVALGYSVRKSKEVINEEYHHFSGMAPAGAINSSAKEMAQWARLWINGGLHEGKQLLPLSYVQESIKPQMSLNRGLSGTKHPDIHMAAYGFGWFLTSYRGHYQVEHGGNIDGFSASTSFFPSDSLGIVVLANQNYSSVPSLIRKHAADLLLGLPKVGWHDHLKEQSSKNDDSQGSDPSRVSKSSTQPSHELEAYVGSFSNDGYGTMNIVKEGDSLFADMPKARMFLRHQHYDVFVPLYVNDEGVDTNAQGSFLYNFRTNLNGEINAIEIPVESTAAPVLFERILLEVHLDEKVLSRYVGEYDLGGVFAEVTLDQGQLYLFVPGWKTYALTPVSQTKFTVSELEGFAIDFEEELGQVNAAMLVQPNGSFRIQKK